MIANFTEPQGIVTHIFEGCNAMGGKIRIALWVVAKMGTTSSENLRI